MTVKQNIFTYRYITEEMEKIEGIFIVGKPEVSVVAIGISNSVLHKLEGCLYLTSEHLKMINFLFIHSTKARANSTFTGLATL